MKVKMSGCSEGGGIFYLDENISIAIVSEDDLPAEKIKIFSEEYAITAPYSMMRSALGASKGRAILWFSLRSDNRVMIGQKGECSLFLTNEERIAPFSDMFLGWIDNPYFRKVKKVISIFGDRFFLMSNGVKSLWTDREIEIFLKGLRGLTPKESAEMIIAAARNREFYINRLPRDKSVVVVDIV